MWMGGIKFQMIHCQQVYSPPIPGIDLAPDESVTWLAEQKHCCSEQKYRTGVRQRQFSHAVDRQARELMGEFQRKADRMDSLLGWRRAEVVAGKYLELSDGGYKLLEAMALLTH